MVMPWSASAGTRSSMASVYFLSLGFFLSLLELCPLECWMFVVRVLQCCSASLAISEMNFCADTETRRTILGSTVQKPACRFNPILEMLQRIVSGI